jgi:uncharacterized phiE125 gp8 family phage protein
MGTLKIATAPSEEPVTLAEMRLQLGITQASDTGRDALITSRIKSARRVAESYMRRAIITQTWDLYSDQFQESFDLLPDLQTVTYVKYYDEAGVLQTLDSSYYQVDTVNHRLARGYLMQWPLARQVLNAVQIRFVSGYGVTAAVPEDIRDAIKFIVGHWENYQSDIERGGLLTRIPFAVEHLLSPYRDRRAGP